MCVLTKCKESVIEGGREGGREGGKAYLALAVLLEEGLEVLVQTQL